MTSHSLREAQTTPLPRPGLSRPAFLRCPTLGPNQVALVVKNPPANAGDIRDVGSIPLWGRYPGDTHSGILAWRISWTEEPGGLQSMGSQRVGHSAQNLSSASPQGSPFLSPALI